MENNNIIDEVLQYLGYKKVTNSDKGNDNKSQAKEYCKFEDKAPNCCQNADSDLENGFQDIDPFLYLIVGELIGNVIAGGVPYNVANAISNYLNLYGQIIETYAAQQVYFQSGPGRFFNPKYRNITNPFFTCVSDKKQDVNIEKEIENLQKKINDMQDKFDKDISGINEKLLQISNRQEN